MCKIANPAGNLQKYLCSGQLPSDIHIFLWKQCINGFYSETKTRKANHFTHTYDPDELVKRTIIQHNTTTMTKLVWVSISFQFNTSLGTALYRPSLLTFFPSAYVMLLKYLAVFVSSYNIWSWTIFTQCLSLFNFFLRLRSNYLDFLRPNKRFHPIPKLSTTSRHVFVSLLTRSFGEGAINISRGVSIFLGGSHCFHHF